MRAAIALLVVGCASSPPPRPATDVAVGSEEFNAIVLPEWSIELPAEALANVHLSWRDGERRAELSLTGAPIGSSVERMADDEARSMGSLEEAPVERRRLRIADVVAVGLRQGEREVVVAMRNPWRALRLAVWNGSADAWLGTRAQIVGVSVDPQWALHEARFECDAYVLTITRTEARGELLAEHAGWKAHLRVKTQPPDDLERLRASFR